MRRAFAGALTAALALAFIGSADAAADDDPPPKCRKCSLGGGGSYAGFTEERTSTLPPKGEAKYATAGKQVTKVVPYEYVTILACGNNTVTSTVEVGCTSAYQTCTDANAPGPYSIIFRRLLIPEPDVTKVWERVGTTCWPNAVPNNTARPQLTMAMIKSQWEHTPFAKPTVATQPVGGATLVTLPVYFQLRYPAAGFQPNEINTVTLLGHQVRIKPTFKHNVFTFGDGSTSGTTQSGGGTYPDGDIKHAYDKRGRYTTSVATTYGGQYSVDGGGWADIPGAITVSGPTSTIEVVTTKNELVNQ